MKVTGIPIKVGSWCPWNGPQGLGKETKGIGNQREN